MAKPYLSLNEQVTLLRKRGLTIADETFTKNALSEFGYYEIVNGYKGPFIIDDEHFIPGTTFEQIFYLFMFDQILRDGVQSSSVIFELQLRQSLARAFSIVYSERQEEYFKLENYAKSKKQETLNTNFKKIHKIVSLNDQPFKHYREDHVNVPPWIMIKGMTFGDLKRFYLLQKPDVKKIVMATMLRGAFLLPENLEKSTVFFSEMLGLIGKYRNRAAHGGRMYNYLPKVDGKEAIISYFPLFHSNFKTSSALYRQGYGSNGIGTLIHILQAVPFERASNGLLNSVNEALELLSKTNFDKVRMVTDEMHILPDEINSHPSRLQSPDKYTSK